MRSVRFRRKDMGNLTSDDVVRTVHGEDRELLELAARAAGYMEFDSTNPFEVFRDGAWYEWNPLTYDGDALRLAVRLRITPHIDNSLTDAESEKGFATEAHGNDPYAATRRAIVRAAAAIAKATP
jgi:hypothetical protein